MRCKDYNIESCTNCYFNDLNTYINNELLMKGLLNGKEKAGCVLEFYHSYFERIGEAVKPLIVNTIKHTNPGIHYMTALKIYDEQLYNWATKLLVLK